MEHVATSYKGRVNERYSTEVVAARAIKVFSKCCQKYVFGLLPRWSGGGERDVNDWQYIPQTGNPERNDALLNL